MKNQTIKIPYILIPMDNDYDPMLPEPKVKGHQLITSQDVTIDGKNYEKLEYIPAWVNLCRGGNAERIRGNKIRILTEPEAV